MTPDELTTVTTSTKTITRLAPALSWVLDSQVCTGGAEG